MNKSPQHPTGGGKSGSTSGSFRGDVSFIRATSKSNPGISTSSNVSQSTSSASLAAATNQQSSEKLPSQHFSTSSLHSDHHHHHQQPPVHQYPLQQQHSQRQHQAQQTPQQHALPHHLQPNMYMPDHIMDSQQYAMKQGGHMGPGGAVGASGDSMARVPPSHTGVEGWSDREEALAAELDEAKVRVAQMEKTMRWWSDCTSNWREKWNKARNERNKAREENRLLRAKLESLAKELSRMKRDKKALQEKQGNVNENIQSSDLLTSQEGSVDNSKNKDSCEPSTPESVKTEEIKSIGGDIDIIDDNTDEDNLGTSGGLEHSGDGSNKNSTLADLADLTERLSHTKEQLNITENLLTQTQNKCSEAAEHSLVLQRKLDDANNTIQAERLEKCNHIRTIETMQQKMLDLQTTTRDEKDEINNVKSELEKLTEQHKQELAKLSHDLEDETSSRTSMDRRVSDLRKELERIQDENASEWAKRERLESEKLSMERENKKLRSQVADLEEEIMKKSKMSSSLAETDMKTLQFDMSEKSKELSELQHSHTKLKKLLNERTTELDHMKRRAEQYESEVRKLRSRVEELKRDLANAEDEVDNQSIAARKSERSNDELQAQVESLRVQVTHLQSRLRSASSGSAAVRTTAGTPRSVSLRNLTLDTVESPDTQVTEDGKRSNELSNKDIDSTNDSENEYDDA